MQGVCCGSGEYYINGAVHIEDDFLKVRDREVIKGGAVFDYEEMADFLEK